MSPLSLQQFNALVREALAVSLPDAYWVTAELSEVRSNPRGHCYLGLVEKDEWSDALVAKGSAVMWANIASVLIPRFDTEVLCEEALRRLAGKKRRVLDIGTGSGAIAVSIAKLAPACEVTAVDISEDALRVARGNAAANGVHVRFVRSDCLCALRSERFDMILSNPPYIDDGEMGTLMPEVLCEPELALRGGADGLDFYRRISRAARDCLAPGGCLLLEIGWKQKEAVEALLREAIGEPFALRDYGNNWRVVGAALPVAGGDSMP